MFLRGKMNDKVTYRLMLIIISISLWAYPFQAAKAFQSTINDVSDPDAGSIIYVPGSNNKNLQTAISEVSDGGVIEIAAGSYPAPSSGFSISSANKSFTIRAAINASVVLTGNGSGRVFDIKNTPFNLQGGIVFEGITFSKGLSSAVSTGAGLTISKSNVTFMDCTFTDNVKTTFRLNSGGGALFVANGATVFFSNSVWRNNSSEDGGGGLGVRDSKVYIHNSQFVNNRTIAKVVSDMPVGAAIYAFNATVHISNTRFEGNQSAGHGAALYINGQWTTSGSNAIISNSTFINNTMVRSVGTSFPIEGGGINVEDNTIMRIYNSRFITNNAQIGGGLNIFRARVEIYNSVFLGNRATDTLPSSGFGGAINFNFYDRPDASSLLIEDSLIQGRYGGVTTVAQYGGGIQAGGLVTSNKPGVTIRRVIFYDVDVTTSANKGTMGGAIAASYVNLLVEDSFILNCDARGPMGGLGGGVVLYSGTVANIQRSVFAFNSSDTYGGAFFAQGALSNISDSIFYKNENNTYGAAIFTTPDTSNSIPATGTIGNSTFVSNVGMPIFDDDRVSGPINAVVYNNNRFYETSSNGKVYHDNLAATQSPQGLNDLVISHSGSSTDKSPLGGNQALSSAPVIAKILAAPPTILPLTASGDNGPTTSSYLGWVWNGSSAQLDGATLTSKSGVIITAQAGQHTLVVDGVNAIAQVSQGAAPFNQTSITPGSPNPNLNWNVTSGTFVSIAANQGLSLPVSASGSVQLPSSNKVYSLHTITREGGLWQSVDPRVAVLYVPSNITVLVGLNLPINSGVVSICNTGGQSINWTAQTSTPDMIHIDTTSGSIVTCGSVPFHVMPPQQPGKYSAQISVDGGQAGSGVITIELIVVSVLHQNFFPYIAK
jgi:hypothetical protein